MWVDLSVFLGILRIFEYFQYNLGRGHELRWNFCRFCIQSCLPTHSCNSASKQEEHISKGWYIIYPILYSLFELQEFFYDPDYLPFQEKTRRVLKINCDFFWKTANTFLVASSHFILPGKIYGFYHGCTIFSNLVPSIEKKTKILF